MDESNPNQTDSPPPNSPPPSNGRIGYGWEKLIYLFLALVQVPFGLVTIKLDRFGDLITNPRNRNLWTTQEFVLLLLMFACCIFAGIGLSEGFRKKRAIPILI